MGPNTHPARACVSPPFPVCMHGSNMSHVLLAPEQLTAAAAAGGTYPILSYNIILRMFTHPLPTYYTLHIPLSTPDCLSPVGPVDPQCNACMDVQEATGVWPC